MSHELLMAYEFSQLTQQRRTVARADLEAILAAGHVAVVERQPRYCGITDAMLPGTNDRLVAVVATTDGARILAEALTEGHYEACGDGHFEVWDRMPDPLGRFAAPLPQSMDEVPF